MSSPIPRRARVALVLALAALAALPASLALADASAAPAAHAALRRCRARGRAGARRCRRATRRRAANARVPAVGATLASADGKLRMTVVAARGANGKPGRAVDVEWDMSATCATGPAGVHLRARAAIDGSSFASNVDVPGLRQQLSGHFVSVHQAAGQVRVVFPGAGGSCDTGVQHFVAQG